MSRKSSRNNKHTRRQLGSQRQRGESLKSCARRLKTDGNELASRWLWNKNTK